MKEIFLLFFTVAITDFFAEMGDKTQFMLIGMSSKYKLRDIVLGTLAAIIVLNGIAVFAGGIVSVFVPDWLIKFIAAAAFFYFGISAVFQQEEDEEEAGGGKFKLAVVAVFCSFFIAELGDKTQLTAITFGANGGIKKAFVIWAACVVGFFAADMIGMLIGLFLKKKMPAGFLNIVSFVLFSFFGFLTLNEGLGILQNSLAETAVSASSAVGAAGGAVAESGAAASSAADLAHGNVALAVPKVLVNVIVAVVFAALSIFAFAKKIRRSKISKDA